MFTIRVPRDNESLDKRQACLIKKPGRFVSFPLYNIINTGKMPYEQKLWLFCIFYTSK